ncbi:Lysophospholipase, alpha-beta hydrolase superfamily [Microbulbifer donghaiensis]|uniref:Lysophospholipase, alpha-beta hydrolase superfamily n=1 Tax=Microbulbifer donghaiensis TaxID=494016 RepID=A0A1M5HCG2_9GAMM|nr:alpha/beta fold hydrolase [Microbulbifer donghaiensis]SHG13650.1 Lysophospholipase, alpha-beta hydrolase superfamily [Microbulbifer donghaiensis]
MLPILPAAIWVGRIFRFIVYSALGALLTLLVVFALYIERLPDLQIWHTAVLDEEYTQESPVSTFPEYLALEERLFAQLDDLIYKKTGAAGPNSINRYLRGSLADPTRWTPNWNRSYLLEAQDPRSLVLLLHGLTDAPYSLRHMGQRLHESGATVLGLRVPGHGTAPSGLVTVRWQDMAAAVRLAMQHLADTGNGRPIHIVGYSNGAALAVHYALAAIDDPELPPVQSLVLISPEIGISPVAALAAWQERLGRLLGIDKLMWNSIHTLEYEPFKYGSFAINAAALSHSLTREIQRRTRELANKRRLGEMPPVLSFSSVVDATVEAPAVVRDLFNLLPAGGHELVLFDINRQAKIEQFLTWNPDRMIAAFQGAKHRFFALTVVTNTDGNSSSVVAAHWPPQQRTASRTALGLSWPTGIYSLSHVALPFAPDDTVYGGFPSGPGPGIRLGNLALRGERGALAISASAQLRLRWNPFYPWLEQRAIEFMGLNTQSRPLN